MLRACWAAVRLAVLVLVTHATGGSCAADCLCPPPKAADALAHSDVLFLGTPIVTMLKEFPNRSETERPRQRTKFRVTKSWKGVDQEYVWVESFVQIGFCVCPTLNPWVGHEMLVAANRTDSGDLEANGCPLPSPEWRFGEGEEFIKDLGPPSRAFEPHQTSETVDCQR